MIKVNATLPAAGNAYILFGFEAIQARPNLDPYSSTLRMNDETGQVFTSDVHIKHHVRRGLKACAMAENLPHAAETVFYEKEDEEGNPCNFNLRLEKIRKAAGIEKPDMKDALYNTLDLPLFAYDLPVCVHTKLDPTMLVTLGKDGVIQGVKDSSGDDVSFRWLVLENEDAGHPLQLLTGHEVCVDGAYLAGADGSVPGLANVDPDSYVAQWKAYQAGDWDEVKRLQDHLARLMFMTRKVKATVGFGAGVGAFKTALWQLGVFNTNQMREPVQALEGEDVEAIRDVLIAGGLLDANA